MKTIEKNTKSVNVRELMVKADINENQQHPYLEQKLEEANKLLKKVGLPKELAH